MKMECMKTMRSKTAPRPDLLPARMRGPAAQPKTEHPTGETSRRALRPERGREAEADPMGRRVAAPGALWSTAAALGSRAGVIQPMNVQADYPKGQSWEKQMPLNRRYGFSREDEKWLKIAFHLGLSCPNFGHASRNSKGSGNKANDAKSRFVSFMKKHCATEYGDGSDEMPLDKAWSKAGARAQNVRLPG
jgi:hypothetical protein